MLKLLIAAAALTTPALASAQALSCAVPGTVPKVRFDGPDAREPRRLIPTASYTLAITWSPGYCRTRAGEPSARFQCSGGNRFGFTLHGLWPDGSGSKWPQYCRPASLLPAATIRRNLCVTPSAQLIQHEWAKHGTCMKGGADAYFARASSLYRGLRYPDMDRLSRRPGLTAGAFAAAFARANPGMNPGMMRVTADRQGWLSEVWLCRDLRFRPTRCPAHQGGLAPTAPLKIWRGRR